MKGIKGLIRRSKVKDQICTLCNRADRTFQIKCYQIAQPLFSYVNECHILTIDHPSIIFRQFLNSKVKEVASSEQSSPITFQDAIDLVWLPVYKKVQDLVVQLERSTITLAVVDEVFKETFEGSIDKLNKDLKNLITGLSICSGNANNTSWIDRTTAIIAQYWEICQHRKHADVFLEFCAKLKLTGDFSLPRLISKGVR